MFVPAVAFADEEVEASDDPVCDGNDSTETTTQEEPLEPTPTEAPPAPEPQEDEVVVVEEPAEPEVVLDEEPDGNEPEPVVTDEELDGEQPDEIEQNDDADDDGEAQDDGEATEEGAEEENSDEGSDHKNPLTEDEGNSFTAKVEALDGDEPVGYVLVGNETKFKVTATEVGSETPLGSIQFTLPDSDSFTVDNGQVIKPVATDGKSWHSIGQYCCSPQ